MKTTKKALSVLLAVIMIMSSMSVCFGTVSFAAGGTVNSASSTDWNTLTAALNNETVKNAAFSGAANNYLVEDPDGSIIDAVEAYWTVFTKIANVNTKPATGTGSNSTTNVTGSDDGNLTINAINTTILNEVKSRMGSNYTDAIGNFITNLASGASVPAKGAKQEMKGAKNNDNNKTVPGTNLTAVGDINLTVKMNSAVTEYTLDNLPSLVVTTKTFTVKHRGDDRYDYTYLHEQKKETEGSGCDAKEVTNNYYTRTYTYFNYITECTATNGNSVSTEVIKTSASTLSSYADYFTADLGTLASKGNATLGSVKTAVNNAKSNVTSAFSEGVFNHFFPTYNVAALNTNIDNAVVVNNYIGIARDIVSLTAENFTGYSYDQLNTLYSTLQQKINNYNPNNSTADAYIKGQTGLDLSASNARLVAIDKEMQLIKIRELKPVIDGHMATFNAYTNEQIDEGTLTSGMIASALTTIKSDKTKLEGYTRAYVDEVCGSDYYSKINNCINHLSSLATTAGYNDRFSAKWAEFIGGIEAAISPTLSADELYTGITENEGWYAELMALVNEMKSVLGDDLANALFDDHHTYISGLMDEAYVALNTKVATQVDDAYALFTAFVAEYPNGAIDFKNVSQYNAMKYSIGLINVDAYNLLLGSSKVTVAQETINKYNELQRTFPDYNEFVASFGFSEFETVNIEDIVRPDTIEDIARENKNGKYVVDDAKVLEVISKLEALLQNPAIKELLGKLINVDKETQEWTGESFNLGGMLKDLIKGALFTDDMINTIIGMLYPLVMTEFIKVWANDLPPDFHLDEINLIIAKITEQTPSVKYNKNLYTVLKESEFYIFPDHFATQLDTTKYAENIKMLKKAASDFKTEFGATNNDYYTLKLIDEYKDDGTQKKGADKTPWDSAALKETVYKTDADGEFVLDDNGNKIPELNDDGTEKTKWALDWGVDAYKESIEADGVVTAKEQADFDNFFYQAFDDAVQGLKPLLLALLANTDWSNKDVKDLASLTISTTSKLAPTVNVTVDLDLSATANRGYANLLIPIYEALGLKQSDGDFKSAATVEGYATSTNAAADVLKAILDPVFLFADKLSAQPLTTILNLLPNVAYALVTDMVPELLSMLKTTITYFGTVLIDRNAKILAGTNLTNLVPSAKVDGKADIDVGTMLNLKDMGVDLTDGLNSILAGFGMNLPALDQGKLATLGTLGIIDTGRIESIYTAPEAGKAYHITANKADVLLYILDWALGNLNGLLSTFGLDLGNAGEFITELTENPDLLIAAIAEILTMKEYDTLREFEWFNGTINGENVLGNSAANIYLNPNNDWTEAKAQYLYNNLDTIVGAILTMAGLDLDKETEGVQADLGEFIGGAIDGLLSDKTLTALAGLLAKLDLNALLAPKAEEEATPENGETPDASEPETVEESDEVEEDDDATTPAIDIDINALVNSLLGIDLAAVAADYADIAAELEADETYVHNFGVDSGDKTFAEVLAEMLEPLSAVLDFILKGENLSLTLKAEEKNENGEVVKAAETVELIGYNGYNNAIIPLLEALGCDVVASADLETSELEATLTALLAKIDAIVNGDTVKGIIDILPGVLYFIASKGLSVTVRNLLQPVYVILDTIRPIYDVNLAELINGLLPDDFGMTINFDDIGIEFIFDLLETLVIKDMDLGTLLDDLKSLIYDVCDITATEYDSASDFQTNWKKGAYSDAFSQADLITVVLSFLLDWASDAENAATLDELLGTDGIIASLNTVFASVEIEYGTPNWMYWFESEEAFNAYLESGEGLPNTLDAIDWDNIGDNDWDQETAQYFANNIDELVDVVIGMINKDKEDAPKTLAALLNGLVNDNLGEYFTDETINKLLDMIKGVLANVDDVLLNVGYELINVNLVGLKNYTCEKEITTLDAFLAELGYVLDTYAQGLLDLLFFGDDIRLAKKPGAEGPVDTIVINGGYGYEKGLAIILEALGCNVPAADEATATNVLESLATRVDEILEKPVEEILDLLPNLVYALNADAAGVAVNNLLKPVNALLDKINGLGLLENDIDLNALLTVEINGEEVEILKNLKLANVVEIIEGATDLPLDAAADILVNFCTGKITKGEFIYKMEAAREDVITILLVVALELISDDAFAAKLNEMLGVDFITELKKVFADVEITYSTPDWGYWFESEEAFNAYLESGEGLPNTLDAIDWDNIGDNDWDKETAQYFADNIDELVDIIIGMLNKDKVDENGKALPTTLADLLNGLVNDNLGEYFTDETINKLLDMIKGVLANVDDVLLDAGYKLINVDLAGIKNYTCTKEIATLDAFLAELGYVLDTYAQGLVDLLFFGDDIRLAKNTEGKDAIVINGGLGYEKGLAMILEALGCDVPAADEATATNVLESLATRVDEILEKPVEEILDLLPNLVYFLNANGAGIAVNNLLAPVNALLDKINALGVLENEINLNDLLTVEINGEKVEILKNLKLANVVEIIEGATDLPLDAAADILVNFCTGKITKGEFIYKMEAAREDVITILLVVALELISDDAFAAKLNEMLGVDFITELKKVFAPSEITYETPDWNYPLAENGTVDAMKYSITYPNNWTEETAEYVTNLLLSEEFDKLISGLIEDGKYASISELLKANVNIFTTETLEGLLELIKGFLGGVDKELLKLGFILDVKLDKLVEYEVKADIDTVEEFAAELAYILGKFAPGVVEWLLLGRDFKLLVKDADGIGAGLEGTPYITISGAEGYKKGLAILLEALGCENLPSAVITEENTTAKIIEGVLTSLAARIDEILSDPIVEVIDLLPNLFYFLNTNGVAAAIVNTTAALTALSAKIKVFVPNVNLDVASMVNLKELLKLPEEAKLSMTNLSMAAVLEAVGMLVGLDLTKAENVLVGFALGKFEAYTSVSGDADAKKMVYADKFDKHDLVTVVANLALLVLADDANAEFVKGLVGEDIYAVIVNILNVDSFVPDVLNMNWQYTSKETGGDKVGESITAIKTSDLFKNFTYGPNFTKEMADYIAANFGTFVDNIIYLLGIEMNGETYESLSEILKELVGENVYNSANVIAIRDAIAGLLEGIATLKVNDIDLGGYIVEVLKSSLNVDITAVAKVDVPEFTKDKDQFVQYLAAVLDPLGTVLKWLLTDEDIAFFVKEGKTDLIKLPGAAGYKTGLVLLLEALGCEGIVAPEVLKGMTGAEIVIAIIDPLLNKVNKILDKPAEELLAVLPNLIYFINSNGVDVVVKNTLNAVCTLLEAISPIADIDLDELIYGLVGLSLDELTTEKLIEMLLKDFELAGFKFTGIEVNDIIGELSVGVLETYDSLSHEDPAYRMVYDKDSGSADEGDMVTVLLRFIIKFISTDNNKAVLVDLLKSLGMGADAEKYVTGLFEFLITCIADTKLGMDTALYSIYRIYYGIDLGAEEIATGKRDLDAKWKEKLTELGYTDEIGKDSVGNMITDIFDIMFNDEGDIPDGGGNDVLDKDGVASNGFIAFFQRIAKFFEEIGEFFRNLFSFGK